MTVWLICRDLRVLALGPPLPPIELCGVREMSVSCFLQGACSPSHSCASPYQPHLCPTHLAWRYHQMSQACFNLCTLSLSFSLSLFSPSPHALLNKVHTPHCYTATPWSHRQPHSPCGPTNVCASQCSCLTQKQPGLTLFSPPLFFLSQEWGSTPPFPSLTWLTT